MLSCQSSLDDLNERLKDPISMANFRPNIVVKGPPAYDEDDWIFVKIGDVILRRLKPCERCVVTTINPDSGKRHPENEPLTTMKGYRVMTDPPVLAKAWAAKPIFGITMGIDSTGKISVGDKVFIARASVHPHLKGF
ncbi:Mitochondrial amidoxime reducing component 2 [Halocaridina rubra]|uniref:Mitochondrial amidoxime reducing component 2 n=1 Tax=Halocaridina rubra TaxID=373956 RepID=A0AAN9A2L0_HALRR